MTEESVERAKRLIETALNSNTEERKRLERSIRHMTGSGSVGPRGRRPLPRPARLKVRPGERQMQVLAELEEGAWRGG